ncbi:MAG: hypothetical protein O2954_03770 [bacterium]|nr:hypothetical protein [bacterium]
MKSFEEEWSSKVTKVRQSSFWKQVSEPPAGRIPPPSKKLRKNDILITNKWSLTLEGNLSPDGPAHLGLNDLRNFFRTRLGFSLRSTAKQNTPCIAFKLHPKKNTSRWDVAFQLTAEPDRITIRASTEHALLRASLYLSNLWSLRRSPVLSPGKRAVRPAVPLHIGADLWGGFCTTQAWIYGRETDTNFLELARMGIMAVPIMIRLEDYHLPDPKGDFRSLVNPNAQKNRDRLAQLTRQAARYGIRILLMGYNPKPDPDHAIFNHHPTSRGALQANGAFRTLCTSDPKTRCFLVNSWASLFHDIPDLGGIVAITGGEGFYHCFMRSQNHAEDCPRCSRRNGSHVVAEFVNAVARGIRSANPEARLLTWPYSANHWSNDRDQAEYITNLDPEHVIFQTEIDKDSVDWRPAGYGKNVWDYSMSRITPSDRCRNQRRLAHRANLPFSFKLEINTSIECLNVPYLPALENQRAIWQNAARLKPHAIHSRWLFDGSCKSPSEEFGYWTLWGKHTEFENPDHILTAIAQRDFGPEAAPYVRRAWKDFSQGLRHHPQLAYYIGSYFIGPAQPLSLKTKPEPGDLDPAFYGLFYWHWENSAMDDDTTFVEKKPLFYSNPGFRAIARRGPNQNQDVALNELQAMATLWERGILHLEKARPLVPRACRPRFQQAFVLAQHLAYTWRSAANVEEFLRLRNIINEFSSQTWVRSGHKKENLRDLARIKAIAQEELDIARKDLALIKNTDFLDLGLRLDMGTESTDTILKAKIKQIEHLLKIELPEWEKQLTTW